MRVAVLLFGEVRGDEATWKNIYDRIILPNKADVFMHHVYYEPDFYKAFSEDAQKVIENHYLQCNKRVHYYPPKTLFDIFKPKKVLFEARPSFETPELEEIIPKLDPSHEELKNTYEQVQLIYHGIRSQSDSRKKVVQLLRDYELEKHIEYDAVIMTRLDVALLENMCILNPLSPHELYAKVYFHAIGCPSYCVPQIREQLLIGSSKSMDVLASFHDHAPSLYIELCNYHSHFRQNEHFMAQHIHRSGINILDIELPLNYYAPESINGIRRFDTPFL